MILMLGLAHLTCDCSQIRNTAEAGISALPVVAHSTSLVAFDLSSNSLTIAITPLPSDSLFLGVLWHSQDLILLHFCRIHTLQSMNWIRI